MGLHELIWQGLSVDTTVARSLVRHFQPCAGTGFGSVPLKMEPSTRIRAESFSIPPVLFVHHAWLKYQGVGQTITSHRYVVFSLAVKSLLTCNCHLEQPTRGKIRDQDYRYRKVNNQGYEI